MDETTASAETSAAAADLFSDRGKSAGQRRHDQARQLIVADVARIARADAEHRGDDPREVFERRGIWPGDTTFVESRPMWEHQLAAGMALVSAARVEVQNALQVARGHDGRSWEEIAEHLGYGQLHLDGKLVDPDGWEMLPGIAAWRFAVTGKGPGERVQWSNTREVFGWKCWSCMGTVSEGHPETGTEAQRGHKDGCKRFAREVAAEKARWNDDEE